MPKRPRNSNQSWHSAPGADRAHGIGARLLIALVRGYQLVLRPMLPPACRFAPSCSTFTMEALGRHGVRRGAVLAVRRVVRCHPWHAGGWDPVPAEER
jgi:putative membrane protein insertion efficiency factor